MEPTTNDNPSARVITALIIGLIVGFLAGAFWQARRTGGTLRDTSAQAAQTESKSETSAVVNSPAASTTGVAFGTATSKNALIVEDQAAGGIVTVKSVTVAETVWVAVREVNSLDGKLGNILGAGKVGQEAKEATIELLRPTVANKEYAVVVYRDVGAPAFNYREDVLLQGIGANFRTK